MTTLNFIEHQNIVENFASIAGLRYDSLEDWKEAKLALEDEINKGYITLEQVEEMYENDETYNVINKDYITTDLFEEKEKLIKLIHQMGGIIKTLDINSQFPEYWLNEGTEENPEGWVFAIEMPR